MAKLWVVITKIQELVVWAVGAYHRLRSTNKTGDGDPMFDHFHFRTNLPIRIVGRANGLSRDDIDAVLEGIYDEKDFKTACAQYKAMTGATLPTDKVGGTLGDFLKQLLDWLSSPEGMAFIKFIFSLFGFTVP